MQHRRVIRQVSISPTEIGSPSSQRCTHFDTRCGTHRGPQRRRNGPRTNLTALGLNPCHARGVERIQRGCDPRFKHLLRRLPASNGTEQRAPMLRQPFEIKHLCSRFLQMVQKTGFCGACTTFDQGDAVRQRRFIQHPNDQSPIAAVSALQQGHPPTDLVQDRCKRARSLTATPAIDHRLPVALFVRQRPLQMRRRVLCNQSTANLTRRKRRDFRIDCPHLGTFIVVQDREIDRTRQVIFGKFGRCPHINNRIGAQFGNIGEMLKGKRDHAWMPCKVTPFLRCLLLGSRVSGT